MADLQKITVTGTNQAINFWASQAFMLTLKGGMLSKTEKPINMTGPRTVTGPFMTSYHISNLNSVG